VKIVTVSYTPLDASGGVPKFNRDIHGAFEGVKCEHYSWWDICRERGWDPNKQDIPEWDKAELLGKWLIWNKKVSPSEDVIIADSFWAQGLIGCKMLVSHQHGNWSHTTAEDVAKGVPPEFPQHAAAQLAFRQRYVSAGHKLTTVSQFIQEQMKLQWGLDSRVINNGIDVRKFLPVKEKWERKRPLIIHFTTTGNKGFDHIEAVKNSIDADVLLLDEAHRKFSSNSDKYEVLAQADLVVHPSAHEGNSYAVLETLSCAVPLVAYDVGLMREVSTRGLSRKVGEVLPREYRNPNTTVQGVSRLLERVRGKDGTLWPREVAFDYTLDHFRVHWREHLVSKFNISVTNRWV